VADPVPAQTISVLIGRIDLTRPPNRLSAVLGSCIGLAIRDQDAYLSGMAHVLLPASRGEEKPGQPGAYADRAVPVLVAALLAHGARRPALRASMAGGARMFGHRPEHGLDVGTANRDAVARALQAAGIPLVFEDCGGGLGRKIHFDPADGRMVVHALGS
jgi:chemotaxis protein CheD